MMLAFAQYMKLENFKTPSPVFTCSITNQTSRSGIFVNSAVIMLTSEHNIEVFCLLLRGESDKETEVAFRRRLHNPDPLGQKLTFTFFR
jgi:hypothetical protein